MLNISVKVPLLALALSCFALVSQADTAPQTAAAAAATSAATPAATSSAATSSAATSSAAPAATAAKAPMESASQTPIGPEVENLKESVLNLNRDLLILQEELLYPPSNQVVLYLSMDVGKFFNLDAVKVEIDNKLVASELYTDKQINALIRGGVQRLYIGNIKAGSHEVSAFFTGRGPQENYKRGAKLMVEKTQDPLVLELKIMDSTAELQPEFSIKQWKSE